MVTLRRLFHPYRCSAPRLAVLGWLRCAAVAATCSCCCFPRFLVSSPGMVMLLCLHSQLFVSFSYAAIGRPGMVSLRFDWSMLFILHSHYFPVSRLAVLGRLRLVYCLLKRIVFLTLRSAVLGWLRCVACFFHIVGLRCSLLFNCWCCCCCRCCWCCCCCRYCPM